MSEKSKLLNTKLKDLPLKGVASRLSRYREILQNELRSKGIHFDFHLWVSDEWFCPDGVPGFAVPFYLFHPQLMSLHQEKTGTLEGKTEKEILKLMRHELGHAIDNAFALRKCSLRQQFFGSSKKSYPKAYSPRPFSKNFVRYLGDGYAQSHPDEDFAETFAYWLDPKKDWKQRKISKVLRQKFEYMEAIMGEVSRRTPVLKNRFCIDSIERNSSTLKKFYQELIPRSLKVVNGKIDSEIGHYFESKQHNQANIKLSEFLKANRQKVRIAVSQKTPSYGYEVDWALKKLIERAERLEVYGSKAEFQRKAPQWIEKNFRYLKETNQLKFYL